MAKFRVELGRWVREMKVVEMEAETAKAVDLKALYESDDGVTGWESDVDGGCDEGTHVVVDELGAPIADSNG